MQHASRRSEKGTILVMTALVLTVMLSIGALAIDASFMYDQRNRMSGAADAASVAAAREVKRSATANLQAFANYEVVMHGFNPADGLTSVVVNHPPASGSFTGDPSYVEVILSRPVATFFARLFGRNTMTVGARATAGGVITPNCIQALSASDPAAIDVRASVIAANCTIASRAGIDVKSGGTLDVRTTGAVRAHTTITTSGSGTILGAQVPSAGLSSMTDPFASLPTPTLAPCIAPAITAGVTLNPGTYCNGLAIGGTPNVTLNPGLYIMDGGGFSMSAGGSVTGSGVTIYSTFDGTHTAGSVSVSNATVTLSAPLSGAYAGILFWQPSNNTSAATLSAGASASVSGAFYFPGAKLTFSAGSTTNCGSTQYTYLISDTLSFTGSAKVCNNVPPNLTGGAFASARLSE
jgi:hypothetical protein